MWVFALEGFVSVVAKRSSKNELLVRGRARADLEHWRKLLGGQPKIRETPHADYGWRLVTTRSRFSRALSKMVLKGIRYDNFKHAVGHNDPDRMRAYMDVWMAMLLFQKSK